MWHYLTLAALPAVVLCAFSHDDIQLFELRDKVAKDLGKDTDFYKWLGLKKGANARQIQRAFRKISQRLHPDRNPGQEATDRFARFNRVYKILLSPVRDRYDYYLSHGFPTFDEASGEWKRRSFRPSLWLSLVLIALIGTFINFLIVKATAHRQRKFIEETCTEVREAAARESANGLITTVTPISNGRHNFMVHPNGEVFFEGEKLDPESIAEPTFYDTIVGKLAAILINPQAEQAKQEAKKAEQSSVSEVSTAEKIEEVVEENVKEAVEPLKKGASRRRAPGTRGKAKIF